MAVYTALTPQDAAPILSGFGLGKLRALEPIVGGIENTNYRIAADRGVFVLTLFERGERTRIERILRVVGELSRRGIPVAAPIGDGPALFEIRGKPAVLTPFAAGVQTDAPTPGMLRSLGATLARLHGAGADLGAELKDGPHTAAVLCPSARALADRIAPTHPEWAEVLRHESDFQESVPEEGLPRGLIHADLFLDNVIFHPVTEEVAALLDFHLAGRGPWIFDVAVALADAAWVDHAVRGERVRHFLSGYRDERALEAEEVERLNPMLRRAVLRYFCLRIERFLFPEGKLEAGRGKPPEEMYRKLLFFRALS
jgi:homoserine kinase type II